jgi:hypothetical protein
MQSNHHFFYFKNSNGAREGIRLSGINCARSDENYCHVYTATRKITLHMSFSELATRLHWDKMLMPLHRQYILRFDCIEEIISNKEGDYVTLVPHVHEQLALLDDHFKPSRTLPMGKEGKIVLLSHA